MSASHDNFETRLASLEREVAQLREQVALSSANAEAARVPVAGAGHDVAEVRAGLRAHTLALNALRETQLEQGEEIREQSREMRQGFTTLVTGMAHITTLLTQSGGPAELS